jgi:hypothetical protein
MNMKNRIITALLVSAAFTLTASAAQSPAGAGAAAGACDRECLRDKVTQVIHALAKHDVSKLPVAPTLRVTEDAVEKPLKNVGLINSVTALQGYRQDFIDERTGMVGAHVMVEESGAPIMLVVRLKVVGNSITEMELVPTRSKADGLLFNIDGLKGTTTEMMNYAPRPEQLNTRQEMIRIAELYPAGLASTQNFAAVKLPFAPNAFRYENGQMMAGPDCKRSPDCKDISTQSLSVFKRLGPPIHKVVAVDERMGIVWMRLAWGVREEGGDQLTAFEAFKVFDGQMHAVEAFIRILPIEKRDGGWK